MSETPVTCHENTVLSAIAAGSALSLPRTVADDSRPFVVVPDKYGLRDLEDTLPAPLRTRQVVMLDTLASFLAYVARFASDHTVIFAKEANRSVTAVIDHAGPDTPAWGQHRATLKLAQTREWQEWVAVHGKRFDQLAMAEFIDVHLPDIASPDGATLLDMVRHLEVRKAVQYQSSVRLDNGQSQLTYIEDVTGTSAKGTLVLPEAFTLGLAPFEGAEKYRLTARLRYRLEQGKVALWFDLLRSEDVVRDAWARVVTDVTTSTGLLVLAGVPPA